MFSLWPALASREKGGHSLSSLIGHVLALACFG